MKLTKMQDFVMAHLSLTIAAEVFCKLYEEVNSCYVDIGLRGEVSMSITKSVKGNDNLLQKGMARVIHRANRFGEALSSYNPDMTCRIIVNDVRTDPKSWSSIQHIIDREEYRYLLEMVDLPELSDSTDYKRSMSILVKSYKKKQIMGIGKCIRYLQKWHNIEFK